MIQEPRVRRRRQVLIVEDEFLVALEIDTCLTRLGYENIGPVPSVEEALHELYNETPDAALLDVNLRGGERVTPVVRACRNKDVPFILVTAEAPEDLHEPLLRSAPRIPKPFRCNEIRQALAELLR